MVRICPSCQTANRIPAANLGQKGHCGSCQATIVPLDAPVEIANDDDFRDLTSKCPLPVLVDFWAPWCGPCRAVAPELVALAKEKSGQLVVAKVDTDQLGPVALRYDIRAIPTLILFRDGNVVDRESGAMRRAAIVSRFVL